MITTNVIYDETYVLSEDNYIPVEYVKNQIVLANTFNSNMRHFEGWKTRYNGKYKKTAPYTIDIHGKIHEHYDPKYYSKYLGIRDMDEQVVPILIENEGWLIKNEENGFIDWVGNIYNRDDEVVERKWRDFKYWAPYGDKQLDAAVRLVKYLCEELNIKVQAMPHNTRDEDIEGYEGVVYKSNYNYYYTDLTPAWEFDEFKNKLEIN